MQSSETNSFSVLKLTHVTLVHAMVLCVATDSMGAFHYMRPTGQRTPRPTGGK